MYVYSLKFILSGAGHEFLELREADFSVVVHVGLGDHLVDLAGVQLVAQSRHHAGQLKGRYEAIVILKLKKKTAKNTKNERNNFK